MPQALLARIYAKPSSLPWISEYESEVEPFVVFVVIHANLKRQYQISNCLESKQKQLVIQPLIHLYLSL